MVVVLRRAELRPVESHQRAHVPNTRGPVQGAARADRDPGRGPSRRGRGEPRLLGPVREHHGRDAGPEHDRPPRNVGRVRDQDAAQIGQSEPRRNAQGRDPVELPPHEEAVHHHLLRPQDSRDPVVGGQQLARDPRPPRGRVQGDPLARGHLVPGLRVRQVEGDGGGGLRRVPHLADRLQPQAVAGLPPAALGPRPGRGGGDMERADGRRVVGPPTVAQGVRPSRESLVSGGGAGEISTSID